MLHRATHFSEKSPHRGDDGSPIRHHIATEDDPLIVKMDDSESEAEEEQSMLQRFADDVLDPNDHLKVTGNVVSDLCTWAKFEWMEPPFEYTLSGMKLCDAYTYLALLGGPEKISFMVQEFKLDEDGDGDISPEEMAAHQDDCDRLVSQALDFLINSGVVGALLLSVLFPQVFIPLIPSDDSLQFFGDTTVMTFYYFYVTNMYLSLFCSLWITYMTLHYYLHITIWMPTTELKMWYVTDLNVMPGVVFVTHVCVISSALALPFGICVGISSEAAVISGIWCIGMFAYLFGSTMSSTGGDTRVIQELHKRTRYMLIQKGKIAPKECKDYDKMKESLDEIIKSEGVDNDDTDTKRI